MIQLRILGPVALDDSNGNEAALLLAQSKRLALLAYLATVSNGTLASRDTVLGLFWPDQPQERARHSLNQALHVLRRTLGTATIVTRGGSLGVDSTRLWCDAAAFQEALKSGDAARALELYRGRLLEGFFAPDCGGFERWMEETRASLHARAAEAAATQALEAATQGNGAARAWARKACELAPHDEGAARHLISLLDGQGDRTGALAEYERLAIRLRQDLEVEPSESTQALIEAIRTRVQPPRSLSPSLHPPHPQAAPPGAPPRPSPRRLRRIALGAATLVLATGAWSVLERSNPKAPAEGAGHSEARVAVLPFVTETESRAGRAARRPDLVELLGSRLDGAGPLRAVPAATVLLATSRITSALRPHQATRLAARLGASSVVEGTITAAAGRLHLHAIWRRTVDGAELAQADAEGDESHLFSVLDTLASQLLARSQPEESGHLARVALESSPSLAASKAFLEGETALAEGRFTSAASAYERAAADSTFALAQYRLGLAALWSEDYPLAAIDAGSKALRHAAGLPDRDRRMLESFDAWRRGDSELAASILLSLIASDKNDLEAWFALGETLFHYNPVRGLPIADAREPFDQVVRINPNHWGALWHLALLDAFEGRTSDLARRLDRLHALGRRTDYNLELATLEACAKRDRRALGRVQDTLRILGEGRLTDLIWRCTVFAGDLAGSEAMARLLLERRRVVYSEQQGRTLLAALEMAQGHRRAAVAQLDSLARINRGAALVQRTLLALIPAFPTPAGELERLREEWRRSETPPAGWVNNEEWTVNRNLLLGRLEAALGGTAAALRRAAIIEQLPDPAGGPGLSQQFAAGIRATVLANRGAVEPALQQYEAIHPRVWFGVLVSSYLSNGIGRLERARLLARLGRNQEALRWYGTLDELSLFDFVYAPVAHREAGEQLERLGQPAAAAAHYRRFLTAWRDADPEFQPLVAQARARLESVMAQR